MSALRVHHFHLAKKNAFCQYTVGKSLENRGTFCLKACWTVTSVFVFCDQQLS